MTKTKAYFIIATFPVIFLVIFIMPIWASILRWLPQYKMRVKCWLVEWYLAILRSYNKITGKK